MYLFPVPLGLGKTSSNKPCKSSVTKQIMLPHTSSTGMAIIHKLDLWLCFTRLSVWLHNFLIMSLEVGSVLYTKAILSSVPLSNWKPNFSCDVSLICSQTLNFTSGFYNTVLFPLPHLTSVCRTAVKTVSSQQSLLGETFVLQYFS